MDSRHTSDKSDHDCGEVRPGYHCSPISLPSSCTLPLLARQRALAERVGTALASLLVCPRLLCCTSRRRRDVRSRPGVTPPGNYYYINMDPTVPRRAPVQLELHGLTTAPSRWLSRRDRADCKKEELEVPMGTTRLVPSTSTCCAPFWTRAHVL